MTKALAVARVTIAESTRRKALFVVLVLWVLMGVATFAQPGIEVGHRIQLAMAYNLRAASFFSVLLGILLASTTIPADIEDKRIFMILTKPVRTWDYLFGKFLGFAAFLALVLALGFVFMSALIAVVFRDVSDEERQTWFRARQQHGAFEMEAVGLDRNSTRTAEAEDQAVLVDAAYPTARWRFRNLDPDHLPAGPIRGEILPRFEALGRQTQPSDSAPFVLRLRNPRSGRQEEIDLEGPRGRAIAFEFDRSLLDGSGRLDLELERPASTGFDHLPRRLDVFVYRSEEHYAANLGKAVLVIYFESLLGVSIALMASCLLSGPIALLVTLISWLIGHLLDIPRAFARRLIESEAMPALGEILQGKGLRPASEGVEPGPYVESVVWVMETFCRLFPDFHRFGVSDVVADRISLTWSGIGQRGLYAGVYVSLALVVGWFFLANTDVDKRREGPLFRLLSALGRRRDGA